MQNLHYKIIAQIISGAGFAIIFSVLFMLNFINYGGNFGCWQIIDKIYNDVGYLSCGNFGSNLGELIGILFGIILVRKLKTTKYKELTIYLIIATFLVPLLIAITLLGPQDFFIHKNEIFKLLFAVIGLNLLPATILTLIFSWKELRQKK